MKRTVLNPTSLHTPFSTYSHGIKIGGANEIIFCAGQVAGDSDGTIVGKGNFWAQGHRVMENLRDVLAEGGATFSNIVKATIFESAREHARGLPRLGRSGFSRRGPGYRCRLALCTS